MASFLHALPPCLIAELCDLLDVSSLERLRLVSKSFRALFDAPFLRRCRKLPIDLSRFGLGMLRRLGAVEPGMRDLTLTCVLYEFPYHYHQRPDQGYDYAHHLNLPRWRARAEAEEERRRPIDFSIETDKLWMEERRFEQQEFSGEDMCAMLTTALGELRSLKTITLTAHIVGPDRRNYRPPEDIKQLHWRELYAHATQAYRVVMSAIARSRPNIEGLHIYRGVKLCGVPTNEVGMPLDKLEAEGFAVVAQQLRSFSIRLASVVDPIRPRGGGAADAGFYDRFDISQGRRFEANDRHLIDRESDPEGVARLLRLMPNLESLDLHFFSKTRGTDESASYKAFLPTVMRDLCFPYLRHLALVGFWATEESSRRIICGHPILCTLTLRHIYLTDGSWDAIFAALRQAASLTRLYLSDLHSPGFHMLLQFKTAYMDLEPSRAAGADHLPGLDGDPVWKLRAISREELKGGLRFSPMSQNGMASREQWAWFVYGSVDFGPMPCI